MIFRPVPRGRSASSLRSERSSCSYGCCRPPPRVMDVLRRFLIVVAVIITGAGPSIHGEAQEVTSTRGLLRHRPHRVHGRRGLGRQQPRIDGA